MVISSTYMKLSCTYLMLITYVQVKYHVNFLLDNTMYVRLISYYIILCMYKIVNLLLLLLFFISSRILKILQHNRVMEVNNNSYINRT